MIPLTAEPIGFSFTGKLIKVQGNGKTICKDDISISQEKAALEKKIPPF